MRVVPVHAPGRQYAVHVAVLARASDVVHDLGTAFLLDRLAHARRDVVQYGVPADALPLAAAARADPAQRKKNAFGVIDLVDGGRAFGAIPTAAGGMVWIALELADLQCLPVDVRQQATSCFAVEANGRHDLVVLLNLARPGGRLVLRPIIPLLGWRVRNQSAGASGIE